MWALLSLRQEWADKTFMQGLLKAAGVRITSFAEPATPTRVKAKLRAAGVTLPEANEAIGMTIDRFLQVNPGLPLWAALALVLESTGKFDSGVQL